MPGQASQEFSYGCFPGPIFVGIRERAGAAECIGIQERAGADAVQKIGLGRLKRDQPEGWLAEYTSDLINLLHVLGQLMLSSGDGGRLSPIMGRLRSRRR
jgi:hypothetical protein